jgi:hypothetical protein
MHVTQHHIVPHQYGGLLYKIQKVRVVDSFYKNHENQSQTALKHKIGAITLIERLCSSTTVDAYRRKNL